MRRRKVPRQILIMALSATSLAGGCSFSDAPPISGSTTEVNLKGTVRVRGKAVTNGIVSFRTANINRPNAPLNEAPIGKDGTYSIKTLEGENFVEVSCKELFTAKNRILAENEQMIIIKPGESTLDIDIPAHPPATSQ
ncbi:hypothetical protein ACYOEI_31480 [Singulisphaera rosea]